MGERDNKGRFQKGHKHRAYKSCPEDVKRKISKALTGKKLSPEHRLSISVSHKGHKPWNKGIKGSIPSWNRGLKLRQRSTKEKIRISESMKKYWLSKGKTLITPMEKSIRESRKYKEWRQSCFIRDKFTCQKCEKMGGKLHVHHKISLAKWLREIRLNLPLFNLYEGAMVYNPLWETNNGVTLCENCHRKTKNYGCKAKQNKMLQM